MAQKGEARLGVIELERLRTMAAIVWLVYFMLLIMLTY
jgi:hypothetical protein